MARPENNDAVCKTVLDRQSERSVTVKLDRELLKDADLVLKSMWYLRAWVE
jgi:hypothetical protein